MGWQPFSRLPVMPGYARIVLWKMQGVNIRPPIMYRHPGTAGPAGTFAQMREKRLWRCVSTICFPNGFVPRLFAGEAAQESLPRKVEWKVKKYRASSTMMPATMAMPKGGHASDQAAIQSGRFARTLCRHA